MDSFAATDRDYSDGQSNREVVPEEIRVYGFKPPVRMPDGTLQLGDYLAANHLNYILNDLYSQLSGSLIVTERSGDSTAGYRVFSNGDVEAWGRATTGSDGTVSVTYGTAMPAVTGDIQLTDTSSANDSASVKVNLSSVSTTGFIIRAANASAAALSGRVVLWKANYHG